jgi:hypothetical protein
VTPPAVTPVAAPTKGGSTAVKVIFTILGIFMVLALLVVGSCFYIGIQFKQKAHQYAHALGGDVPAYTGSRVPCAVLSKQEASTALGQAVSGFAQVGMSTCEYRFGPGGQKRVDVEYTWEHGAVAMGLAHNGLKAVSGGMDTMTSVKGIGDDAYVVPGGSGFMMRKGDVMVNIDLRVNGVTVDQAEAMCRTIATHL